ncbi:MAG: hypothetical protein QXL82_03270 [Candidatus Aenigmatarchaeota archaeon]
MKKEVSASDIELEKLKAKVDVLIKIKEEMNNRISFLNERIGEIKSSLIDKEKEIAELKANIEKSIKIMQELKPEEIIKKFNEFYTKLEVFNARLESNESLLNKIIEELKEIRRVYLKFKSFEELEKIEKEFKKDFSEIKKSEEKIFSQSAKVESIYLDINKKIEEILNIKKDVEKLKDSFKDMLKDLNELKILSSSFIRKEELNELKERLKNIKALEEELRNKVNAINLQVDTSKLEEFLNSLKKENEIIFEKLKLIDNILIKQKELENQLNKVIFPIKDVAKKSELEELNNKVMKYLLEMDKIKKDVEKSLSKLEVFENKDLNKKVYELEKKYEELNKNVLDLINIIKSLVEA